MKNYEIILKERKITSLLIELLRELEGLKEILQKESKPVVSLNAKIYKLKRLKLGADNYIDDYNTPITGNLSALKEKGNDLDVKLTNEEKNLIKEIYEFYKIDVTKEVSYKIVGVKELKKAVIRKVYEAEQRKGRKYLEIKKEISKKYKVSLSTIEKLIYKKK